MKADSDAIFHLIGLDSGVVAQDRDAAAGALPEPFEDFDGSGFSGAIGPKEAKDFAGADFEIDSLDSPEGAIILG